MKPYQPVMADPVLESWRWRHEEAVEGMGTLCMDKAEDGSLWFGGTGGITRYDGRTVTSIRFDDELLSAITHREEIPWVKALMSTGEGTVLALIGESLVSWSESGWKVIIQDVGQSVFFNSLVRGKDGSYWLQVREGLWQISRNLEEVSRIIHASRKSRVMSACIDQQGTVWVVRQITDDEVRLIGIPLKDGRPLAELQWMSFPVPFHNDSEQAGIIAGTDGLIWYVDGARGSGLVAFDSKEMRWLEAGNVGGGVGLYSLVKLTDGSIWAGGEGTVLRRTPKGDVALYTQQKLDLPLVPLMLFNFGDGRLWLIGRGGLVYSIDLSYTEWMTYAGLNFQCETRDGTQWFLSEKGRYAISHDPQSGEWLRYGPEDGLIDVGFTLMASSHGLIWMAGSHEGKAGLAVFDGGSWTRFRHPGFAEWIEPNAVFEASDGTVWLGAGGNKLAISGSGGALQYGVDENGNPGLIKHFGQPQLPYYAISFAETREGRLVLGSTIVHSFSPADAQVLPLLSYPRDNTVNMFFGENDALWVAKEHSGLYRYENGTWRDFSVKNGLAGTLLSGLLLLRDGTVLAATDRGISRFDGTAWEKTAYPEEFGMSKRWSGMRETMDGSVWLSYSRNETMQIRHLISGANVFRTTRHRAERRPPDTYITGYLTHVAQPGNSHISWDARDLWGDTPRELLQFSWRLNGGEWSAFEVGTGRMFPGLKHGRHLLEVRARDRAFNVDPTPASAEFVVVAPLWLQPWFISMVIFMIGGSVLLVWMMVFFYEKRMKDRQRHLVEMDHLKTSFFTNLSHELRTPLSVMLSPLESLRRSETDEVRREKLSMVIRGAERVTALLTQLLDFRRLEQGKMPMDLCMGDIVAPVRKAVELLMPMAQARRVECRLEGPDELPGLFDEDKLRKITSNLVGNAIKYTRPGGEVVVRLDFSAAGVGQDRLILLVEDCGAGIEPGHLEHIFDRFFRGSETTAVDGSGIGLNFAKELVDLWGGEIRAESPIHSDAERPGTRFVVELPIGENGDSVKSRQRKRE